MEKEEYIKIKTNYLNFCKKDMENKVSKHCFFVKNRKNDFKIKFFALFFSFSFFLMLIVLDFLNKTSIEENQMLNSLISLGWFIFLLV